MATPERIHDLAPLLVLLVDLKHIASASGASRIANDLAHVLAQNHERPANTRRLFDRGLDACNRLHAHLFECTHALDSTLPARAARVRSFRVARTLIDTVIDKHFAQRTHSDGELARVLAAARTRFLMGRKADAITNLVEHLARVPASGRTRLARGLDAVREIADMELVAFEQTLASHVRATIVGHARRLFEQWADFVEELGESLAPRPVTLDLSMTTSPAAPTPRPVSERHVTLRLAVSPRLSIDEALRDVLLAVLDERSAELVLHVRHTYGVLDSELERSFSAAVDEAVEGTEASESLLRDALSQGADNLVWARHRAARWRTLLRQIAESLRAGNRSMFVDELS